MRVQEAGWYEVRTAAGEPLPSHTDYATGTLSLQVVHTHARSQTHRHTHTHTHTAAGEAFS